MRFTSLLVMLFCYITTTAQNTFEVTIRDAETNETIPGAIVLIEKLSVSASADENGVVRISSIPDGTYPVRISHIGYETLTTDYTFPMTSSPVNITLTADEEVLEEIVITSTRSSRTIADMPTRVEFIAGEELDEKANMKPGDIRMLLSESTGIQVQQTSPTSANASIRIQGLDGRYTQILKDGLPLYAGFSGGLGMLQTPPLDLRQAEVIKGSSSTLYGGGAIAGLVNLISKVPTEERELKFFINGTSAKGLDLNGFYGEKFEKFGLTVFAARNSSEPYDPADIDLTAIPKYTRYTFNPRAFFDISEKTKINVGFNMTSEDRIGGDLHYIEGNGDATHSYFERNESFRFSTQVSASHQLDEKTVVNFKNSVNHFDRVIEIPSYRFDGSQNGSFTELNVVADRGKTEWIAGLNLWTDNFKERIPTDVPLRDYEQTTVGAFVQNTSSLSDKLTLEAGLRADYVFEYGTALLPRISLLYKASPKFSSRLGGGLGYKAPTIFTEESERFQYRKVLPVSSSRNKLEKSYGANWDLNYRTEIGDVSVNINHLFFYTDLTDPLQLILLGDEDALRFENMTGRISSKGTETNVKFEYHDFKLFIGYTFTETRTHELGLSYDNILTPKHRMNNVLMYEVEEKWKVGLEAYYFSRQRLSDEAYGKPYWICGFMVEKLWENFSVFINFENFLDARQTRFDTIYSGSISSPVFRDIYAPVDGFVMNGGLKLNL